jgi:hypothetical protein
VQSKRSVLKLSLAAAKDGLSVYGFKNVSVMYDYRIRRGGCFKFLMFAFAISYIRDVYKILFQNKKNNQYYSVTII